jgi:hypothetical protein
MEKLKPEALTSITRHAGINFRRPSIDSTRNVGHVFEPARFKKVGHLHAAPTVMTQAGHRLVGVKF